MYPGTNYFRKDAGIELFWVRSARKDEGHEAPNQERLETVATGK